MLHGGAEWRDLELGWLLLTLNDGGDGQNLLGGNLGIMRVARLWKSAKSLPVYTTEELTFER